LKLPFAAAVSTMSLRVAGGSVVAVGAGVVPVEVGAGVGVEVVVSSSLQATSAEDVGRATRRAAIAACLRKDMESSRPKGRGVRASGLSGSAVEVSAAVPAGMHPPTNSFSQGVIAREGAPGSTCTAKIDCYMYGKRCLMLTNERVLSLMALVAATGCAATSDAMEVTDEPALSSPTLIEGAATVYAERAVDRFKTLHRSAAEHPALVGVVVASPTLAIPANADQWTWTSAGTYANHGIVLNVTGGSRKDPRSHFNHLRGTWEPGVAITKQGEQFTSIKGSILSWRDSLGKVDDASPLQVDLQAVAKPASYDVLAKTYGPHVGLVDYPNLAQPATVSVLGTTVTVESVLLGRAVEASPPPDAQNCHDDFTVRVVYEFPRDNVLAIKVKSAKLASPVVKKCP
jgi:hypothetical protein